MAVIGESREELVPWKANPDELVWSGPLDFTYPDHSDPRWPTTCEQCGLEFTDDDEWQEWHDHLYRRDDTGDEYVLRDAPVGAMWHAWWFGNCVGSLAGWPGEDGLLLQVRCPGGDTWTIDSRASNCTMPEDNEHRCWVRHGVAPLITVDKNGRTCQAGGGSIQTGNYHGFLQGGAFT